MSTTCGCRCGCERQLVNANARACSVCLRDCTGDEPVFAWVLNHNDREFLRKMRIVPE